VDGGRRHGVDFQLLLIGGDLLLLMCHGEGWEIDGDVGSREVLDLPGGHHVGWLEGGGAGSQGELGEG